MEKRYSQLELFTGGQGGDAASGEPRHGFFSLRINGYEKTLFLLIGFLVTGVSFYCLGVEHGKARAMARVNAGFDIAARPAPAAVQPVMPRVSAGVPAKPNQTSQAIVVAMPAKALQTVKGVKPVAAVPAPKVGTLSGQEMAAVSGFTIQIGTYQVRAAAERERDNLVKIGLTPAIVKQGAYNVVIVGNFSDKEMAKSLLSRLRQNYRDCYIRRL